MNFRGLYKWAGVSAIAYAAIVLVGYAISVSTNGFLAESSTPPSPDRILSLIQARGNQIASRLNLVSYFFWIPAVVGLFAYLRDRRPGRAHLGAAFAAFGLIGFFATSAIESTAINLVQGPVTDTLKDRLAALYLASYSCFLPALHAMAVANLLWGLALRTQLGIAKTIGNAFLLQVAGFLIASAGFAGGQDVVGNTGIFIHVVATIGTYATLGLLLRRASKEEVEVKPTVQEKPHAAGASA